jgi:hypothetical protein
MRGVTIVTVTSAPSPRRRTVEPSRRIPRFYSGGVHRSKTGADAPDAWPDEAIAERGSLR